MPVLPASLPDLREHFHHRVDHRVRLLGLDHMTGAHNHALAATARQGGELLLQRRILTLGGLAHGALRLARNRIPALATSASGLICQTLVAKKLM
jgi:hypothetical protein